MGTTLRTVSLCIAAALFAACGRDAVEQKLVGSWQTAVASPTGPYELHFTTQSNGQYRTDVVGAAGVPAETGRFKATGGHWRLERPTGSVDEGTYEFVSDDGVLFKSRTGVVLWTRLSNDIFAGIAATSGTPSQVAAPIASSPGGLVAVPGASPSGAASLSADLLATGPFGPAVGGSTGASPAPGVANTRPDAAAFAAPASAGGFGAPSAGGLGASASAGGFAAPVQSPDAPQAALPSAANPPTGAAQTPPTMTPKQAVAHAKATVQQTASQTAATARAGAQQISSQAATSATDAVDDAAAETNKKVGQKIGTFAGNVGSKIKNFFTGAKRHSADTGSTDGSTTQPQDTH
jgi:hypothetical protein